jgi:predicted AlkP superfamily pyrophosphatase or phosphodiesterase
MRLKKLYSVLLTLLLIVLLPSLLTFGSPASAVSADQAPSLSDARFKHVLLISVDGLHAQDLARYIKANPHSTLAALSKRGVT